MTWQDAALGAAGVIGIVVAVIQGRLVQRFMVRPLNARSGADDRMLPSVKKLTAPLLQVSTYNWLIGGVALIIVAGGFEQDVQVAIGLLVGSSHIFGAAGISRTGADLLGVCSTSGRLN